MYKRFLETGQIVNTHGIKGEVRVMPWCDTPKFLTKFDGFYFDEGKTYKKAESVRANKGVALIKFEGIDDINEAVKLVKSIIYIDREWVDLPEGSYFEQDLLGLSVEDADTGEVYGVLSEVGKTGANDIYRVDLNGRQVWIPAVKEIIKSVDISGGKMLIAPIKGMFDDED